MGKTGIFLVHGILGRKEQFDPLLPLIPKEFVVRNITLKGHGQTPVEFGKWPMNEWKKDVHKELSKLCEECDHVYIVGHSLGTLFAIQESLILPVDGMFLLNVPLKVKITPKLFSLMFQMFFDCVDPKDPFISAAKNSCGIALDKNLLHYVKWIPRYIELFREIHYTRKIVDKVTTKSIACISVFDEMAAPASAYYLRNNPNMKVLILRKSGHFYYENHDLMRIKKLFIGILPKDI